MVTIPEDEYLAQQGVIAHYGTPRHSGRYPWGSGDDDGATQRNTTLLAEAVKMKAQGLSDVDIAKGLDITTTQLRDIRTVERNKRKQDEIAMARNLKAKGMSNGTIAARMRETGYDVSGESQVRNLLKDSQERKVRVLDTVSGALRKAVDEKGFIDVGSGVEFQLNITSTKLRSALQVLKDEGYVVHPLQIDQLGTGQKTNMRVLTKPGTEWGEAYKNRDNIRQLQEYSDDGGLTLLGIAPPKHFDSKRLGIRYDEDGGSDADGVIYVRRGVPDVSLGGKNYGQVRIAVDGTHYIKGMAIYKDDLPDGVDLQFNTNKKNTGNKLDALKPLKIDNTTGKVDADNPFGSSIRRQIGEIDPRNGKVVKPTSVMNLVNEEGDWALWSSSLSSQVLSKQRPALAREQLDLAHTSKKSELDSILQLTNPSVRRKLLDAYAASVEAAAVHLKAAALPKQKTQVILPVNDLKTHEVYAPSFDNGTRVALIRFPHGGTFEIPELIVNNRNPSAKKLLGDSRDAIGIHSKVAERLSGADFDGDTVLVIPNNLGKVKSTSPLEGLRGFDPKVSYPPYEGMPSMAAHGPQSKGFQMGLISNLITDMTIQGATDDEKARAVRHSMVVIDAEKHNLDYRRSAEENGIQALIKRYQPGAKSSTGGAQTLISRATSRLDVPERKPRAARDGGPIDPTTGKKVYDYTGRTKTWTDANGKLHVRQITMRSTKLAETNDARTLSSGTVVEEHYAVHSNRLKSLANQARKAMVAIKSDKYSPSAKLAYKSEVQSLNDKLNLALQNAPLERQAQVFANATVRMKLQSNPELRLDDNKAELKRLKSQALAAARTRTGADKKKFEITEAEWKAITARAITAHKLDQILNYADLDMVKKLASPRDDGKMTPTMVSKAKSLHARDYTWAEIAAALGVSVSTIQKEVGSGEGD